MLKYCVVLNKSISNLYFTDYLNLTTMSKEIRNIIAKPCKNKKVVTSDKTL